MVKYWIYYEDGTYELINCPECHIDEVSHVHAEGEYEGMVCNQCATRFDLEDRKEKIVKIVSEDENDGGIRIISEDMARALKEMDDRARRLRRDRE